MLLNRVVSRLIAKLISSLLIFISSALRPLLSRLLSVVYIMNRLIITVSITICMLFSSGVVIEAFVQKIKSTQQQRTYHVNNIILQARKYVVIVGNIDGINPNEEEDTYNMSKKERRRREREKGAADFKSGKYKLKKKSATKINYDKLEDKVTRERTLLPREQRESATTNTRKKTRVEKKLSVKAARIKKQRTVGGMVDSSSESMSVSPEKQAVQIRLARRANKTVTMIQGLCVCFICALHTLFRLGLYISYH